MSIQNAARKCAPSAEGRHVFVAGLARAGTTILLRALYESGEFRSLTYRHMPFVTMPHLWEQVVARFPTPKSSGERAHGDGLVVDYDSPEALEEVFWRAFCGADYIERDRLRPHEVAPDVIELFRSYVGQIVCEDGGEGSRYLSKNNNNILRLPAISHAFPDARILVPFRDPFQQAASLLGQHVRFCELHSADRFSADYMRWLGHHEFGLTHKPFCFSDATEPRPTDAATHIDYWLSLWCDVYSHLLDHLPPNARFVCFERLCSGSADTVASEVLEPIELDVDAHEFAASFSRPERHAVDVSDRQLLDRAVRIYMRLGSSAH